MHTKHTTENAAREAARKLGNVGVQIVLSKDQHDRPMYFVERHEEASMIRNWERLVYSGLGKNCRPKKEPKQPTAAQVNHMNGRILGNFFASL